MPYGQDIAVSENSVTAPAVVTRTMASRSHSAIHTLPSGPPVMPRAAPTVASVKVVMVPAGVTRLIAAPLVNHTFPSGPAVMAPGFVTVASVNVATAPAGVIRPMAPWSGLVNH